LGSLKLLAGIHLHLLPPYSPELQPAERLWPLTNEALANRHFRDLDELQTVQAQRCLALQARPEMIEGHTSFHALVRRVSQAVGMLADLIEHHRLDLPSTPNLHI
jgi:hypothetical protein